MYREKTIALVIPAYDEEKTIGEVIRNVPKFVDKIIVIDDGSSDATGKIAVEAGARVIRHPENRGVGAAFHSGLFEVLENDFDIMVNIDADGQFQPQNISSLLDPIFDDQADFVTACRFSKGKKIINMPWIKRWGNHRISSLVNWMTGKRFCDVSCGFRAYSHKSLVRLHLYGRFTYTQETFINLAFANIRIREIPVEVKYFKDRKSRVTASIPMYALQVLKIMLRAYRDYCPLVFFWGISLLLLLPALGTGTFFFAHYLLSGHFTPHIWAGFISAFFFCNSLAFFLAGILADMFDRIRKNQERIIEMLYLRCR